MGKLPDRWLDYQPMGTQIRGTKFICFKVPLKEGMCNETLSGEQRFTPEMLRQRCPNVKLVVDLTNTTRYYNGHLEFSNLGVKYKKILTPGHVIPPSDFVTEFFTAVDSFLSSPPDDDSLIGVHCTHGLNRTSYFICSYMINRMGFDPREAMNAFEEARGHKIERQNYIDDLLKGGKGSTMSRRPAEKRRGSPLERPRRTRWSQDVSVATHQDNRRSHVNSRQPHPTSREHSRQTSHPPNHPRNTHQFENWRDRGSEGANFLEPSRGLPPYQSNVQSRAPTEAYLPPAMTYAEHRARQAYNWGAGTPTPGGVANTSRSAMEVPHYASSSRSIPRAGQGVPNNASSRSIPRSGQGVPNNASSCRSIPRSGQGVPNNASSSRTIRRPGQGMPDNASSSRFIPRTNTEMPRMPNSNHAKSWKNRSHDAS